MDVTNNEYFRTIRKAIENRKLAIFVGSAVSYDSDLPSWGQLVSQMKNALDISRTDDYLKIAEHYYLQFGRNTYYNKINEFFPSGSQPNQLHELLLSLKPQHIITTNWDDLLEKAINNKGDLYFPVTDDHELASAPTSQLLVKMHGDLSHRNIVFKESDYLSYSDNFPLIENFVKSLFSTHVVVFIGYSISDYNLNQIISWVRNRTNDAPPAYTILTENKITLSESNYLIDKGIYPILSYSKDIKETNYSSLSEKSKSVAKIISRIIEPEREDIPNILSEIAKDISSWKAVHPSNIVRLLRDRLNITEINKVYYFAEENTINYNIDKDDLKTNRKSFRTIRKDIVKILSFIPVSEIRLTIDHNLYYKIVNRKSFNFRNEFTEFNFKEITDRASSSQIGSNNDIDKQFQVAYDNYYIKKLNIARDSFTHISNLYFSKSLFINSLISSYNKKQLCFGEIPWDLHSSFLEISQSERLSQNDNISDMIEKFPKSIVMRQKSLFQGLDSNNSLLLENFRDIANLSREIDEEIENINNGSLVISNKLNAMYNRAFYYITFIIANRITVLYSSDYKVISKIAFESMIKRQSLEEKIEVDELLSYMAIVSFKDRDLVKFLTKYLAENKPLNANETTLSYLLTILENSLKEISSPSSRDMQDYSLRVWTTAFVLISYIRLSENDAANVIQHAIKSYDTRRWFDLSETINRFLVLQVNRYKSSFSTDDLTLLFNKQMEKLTSNKKIPFQEKGQLFNSLLYLINENSNVNDIFSNNEEIKTFIDNISKMNLKERMQAIDSFVFTIHSLAVGDFKEEITSLLRLTFEETKSKEFNESMAIFCLNLHITKVIDDSELYTILDKLSELADNHIKNRSASSAYTIIQEQINDINKEGKLANYERLLENVAKISDAIKNAFNR